MHESACPVIVAPLEFESIKEIIFTYDGSRSSLYAVREFVRLFPQLKEVKATILQVWAAEDEHAKDQQKLVDWLIGHFSKVESILLEGDSKKQLLQYLLAHTGALIVMGGFGRNRVSRMLKHSTSEDMLKLVLSPIFIAHL